MVPLKNLDPLKHFTVNFINNLSIYLYCIYVDTLMYPPNLVTKAFSVKDIHESYFFFLNGELFR